MGCRVMYDPEAKIAAFYCSTSDHAFGPVFYEDPKSEWSAAEEAEFFLRWLPRDARGFAPEELETQLGRFREAKPVECGWSGCDWQRRRVHRYRDREKAPATAYDFLGKPNPAHKDGFCSEECRDAASEDADERNRDAYYGASTPQTEGERYTAAAEEKARLG